MPYRNRVDPWGCLHAVLHRGSLMGNRGNLHDAAGNIVRMQSRKAWIYCELQYKDRHRKVMSPGQYTELFFLDEATALAAGHRPCGTCKKTALQTFRKCWLEANGLDPGHKLAPSLIDQQLAVARKNRRRWEQVLSQLPDGALVHLGEEREVYLWWRGRLHEWGFAGYGPGSRADPGQRVEVVTPRDVVDVLAAGYPVTVHPTALA